MSSGFLAPVVMDQKKLSVHDRRRTREPSGRHLSRHVRRPVVRPTPAGRFIFALAGPSCVGLAQIAVQLLHASSLCLITQNRITVGVGRQDFLLQGLDLDLFAGGLLNAEDQFGPWQVSVAAYYVGLGLTWRYGACGGHCGDSAGTCATCNE